MAGRAILESHSSTSKFYGHDEKIEKKIVSNPSRNNHILYQYLCK